jgi:hypothetical protein
MSDNGGSSKSDPTWLVYAGLIVSGALLLADAFNFHALTRWTAKIGIGLIWTALALMIGKGRWAGNFAVIVVWLGVLLTYWL